MSNSLLLASGRSLFLHKHLHDVSSLYSFAWNLFCPVADGEEEVVKRKQQHGESRPRLSRRLRTSAAPHSYLNVLQSQSVPLSSLATGFIRILPPGDEEQQKFSRSAAKNRKNILSKSINSLHIIPNCPGCCGEQRLCAETPCLISPVSRAQQQHDVIWRLPGSSRVLVYFRAAVLDHRCQQAVARESRQSHRSRATRPLIIVSGGDGTI